MRWRSCSSSCTGPLWIYRLELVPGTVCEQTVQKENTGLENKLSCIWCLLSYSQVVLAADMLGLEGLKDVVEMVLTREYCRFFPKVRYTEGNVVNTISDGLQLPYSSAYAAGSILDFSNMLNLGLHKHDCY